MITGSCPLRWVDYPEMTKPEAIKDPELEEAIALLNNKAKEQALPFMTVPLRLKRTSDLSSFFPGHFLKNATLVLTGTDVLEDETHQRLVTNINGVEANDSARRMSMDTYRQGVLDAFNQWRRGNSDHKVIQILNRLLKWGKTPQDKAFLESLKSNPQVQEKLSEWTALKNEGDALMKTFQEFSKPLLQSLEDKLRGAVSVERVIDRLAKNRFLVKTGGYLPDKDCRISTVAHEAVSIGAKNG